MFDTYRMTKETFASAVKSINTRGKKLQDDIHRAAVAAMLFSLHRGLQGNENATPALQLCQGLTAGLPRNKVINWFTTFTNVRITVTNGGKTWAATLLKPGEEGHKELTEADIKAAIDCPYWDNDPEVDVPPMDLDAAIAALIKKATTAIKDGKVKNPERAEKQLASLQRLAPKAK